MEVQSADYTLQAIAYNRANVAVRTVESGREGDNRPENTTKTRAQRVSDGVDQSQFNQEEAGLASAFDVGNLGFATSTENEDDAQEAPEDLNAPQSATGAALTEEEQTQVRELQARDAEVRAHEQAHLAAAGGLAQGGASFTFQTGPDGKQYAIGGEVNIDTSRAQTPEATLAKAKQVQRAALAPAEPSAQDIKVAAQAVQMQLDAQREIVEQQNEAREEGVVPEQSNEFSNAYGAAVEAANTFTGGGRLDFSEFA